MCVGSGLIQIIFFHALFISIHRLPRGTDPFDALKNRMDVGSPRREEKSANNDGATSDEP
jgi:hypothetical protein